MFLLSLLFKFALLMRLWFLLRHVFELDGQAHNTGVGGHRETQAERLTNDAAGLQLLVAVRANQRVERQLHTFAQFLQLRLYCGRCRSKRQLFHGLLFCHHKKFSENCGRPSVSRTKKMSTTPSAKGVRLSFLPGFLEITSPGGKSDPLLSQDGLRSTLCGRFRRLHQVHDQQLCRL